METSVTPHAIAGTAADDLAVSRGLLDRVAAGELDGALRIWRPVPAVAFSKLDLLISPGAGAAVTAAQQAGLEAIQRMSGGHAVVLGSGSLCAGIAERATAFEGMQERYQRLSAVMIAALGDVGVRAEPGELRGEWCPGAWSLHAGPVKLAGLSQRVVRGAAWTEAVVQLEPPDAGVYEAVYAALGLPFDRRTLGSVAAVRGAAVEFEELAAALGTRLADVTSGPGPASP